MNAADMDLFLFAWIGISSVLRFLSLAYISKTMKTYEGFHNWTLSSLFNMIGFILLIMAAPNGILYVYLGYINIYFAMILLPLGIKHFGNIKEKKIFPVFTTMILTISIIQFFTLNHDTVTNFSVLMYTALIPVFLLSFVLIQLKNSSFKELRTHLLSVLFILSSILSAVRLLAYYIEMPGSSESWLTICIDINSTLIYFNLIVLNFRKTERDLKQACLKMHSMGQLLPTCSSCKKIKDINGEWKTIEMFVENHNTEQKSIKCPSCEEKEKAGSLWFKRKSE